MDWNTGAKGCSDGLFNEVHEDEIHDVLTSTESAQEAADELVERSVAAGGRVRDARASPPRTPDAAGASARGASVGGCRHRCWVRRRLR